MRATNRPAPADSPKLSAAAHSDRSGTSGKPHLRAVHRQRATCRRIFHKCHQASRSTYNPRERARSLSLPETAAKASNHEEMTNAITHCAALVASIDSGSSTGHDRSEITNSLRCFERFRARCGPISTMRCCPCCSRPPYHRCGRPGADRYLPAQLADSAATPGSSRPSIHSRNAPPAVDTKVKSSATPA